MSERDRQNPYERSDQQGAGYRGSEGYASPRQANQWQSEDHRQQGGDWQNESRDRGNGGDDSRDYRFSGQAGSQDTDYSTRLQQDDRESERGQGRHRGGYSQQSSYGQQSYGSRGEQARNWDRGQGEGDWQRAGSRGRQSGQSTPYAGRDFDASGGNDFGNFTSQDYGGRDFYNRGGGGATGGLRPSDTYRPSYGVSRLFDRDNDDRSHSGGRDYGDWRQYGESRGFLQRAGDEIASWFGDEDASRRRDQDARHDERESHRGKGPSNYTRSDERIREDANDHLTHDWGVDASNVTVSVKDGELTLDGTVHSRQAKRRAEDAVEHIAGVKHVQNNLRVQESASNQRSTSGSTSYASGSSSAAGSNATTAADTSGIGSTTTAGLGTASTARSGDKTS